MASGQRRWRRAGCLWRGVSDLAPPCTLDLAFSVLLISVADNRPYVRVKAQACLRPPEKVLPSAVIVVPPEEAALNGTRRAHANGGKVPGGPLRRRGALRWTCRIFVQDTIENDVKSLRPLFRRGTPRAEDTAITLLTEVLNVEPSAPFPTGDG
eukprot:1344147-Prymnesium_polylepis.1